MAAADKNTNTIIDNILENEYSEKGQSPQQFDTEGAFRRFQAMVEDAETEGKARRRHAFVMRMVRYAAVLVVVVAVAVGSYLGGDSNVRSQLADVTMTVPRGSQTKVTLPDGTVVTLNAGSEISYSQAYGLQSREVSLSGEAYFEVKHDTDCPFVVSTPTLRITDIGTTFNISDYQDDATAEVTMAYGRVSVADSKSRNLALLEHDDKLVYNKEDGTFVTSKVTDEDNIAWIMGILHFNGESMAEVATVLERAFNVFVEFDDPTKKNLHFYGDFSYTNDKVTDILDVLSATGKIRYTKKNKKITIY